MIFKKFLLLQKLGSGVVKHFRKSLNLEFFGRENNNRTSKFQHTSLSEYSIIFKNFLAEFNYISFEHWKQKKNTSTFLSNNLIHKIKKYIAMNKIYSLFFKLKFIWLNRNAEKREDANFCCCNPFRGIDKI